MALELQHALTDEQVEQLWRMYQAEWWTKGRRRGAVEEMLRHCDVIVAFSDSETGKLAAFARVLTDYVYKALILDVIVEASYRNTGLGRALIDAILQHPSLQSVEHFELYCRPGLVPFYRQWGFREQAGELRFLRLDAKRGQS